MGRDEVLYFAMYSKQTLELQNKIGGRVLESLAPASNISSSISQLIITFFNCSGQISEPNFHSKYPSSASWVSCLWCRLAWPAGLGGRWNLWAPAPGAYGVWRGSGLPRWPQNQRGLSAQAWMQVGHQNWEVHGPHSNQRKLNLQPELSLGWEVWDTSASSGFRWRYWWLNFHSWEPPAMGRHT